MAEITINFPQNGGTKHFGYEYENSCHQGINITFSKDNPSDNWFDIISNEMISDKEGDVAISASTNDGDSVRSGSITTYVCSNGCPQNKINIIQRYSSKALEYLTFVPSENATFKFNKAIEYTLDDGVTWVTLPANTNTPTIASGNKIKWRAELEPQWYYGVGTFSSNGHFEIEGNPLSILFGDDFVNHSDISEKDYAVCQLFADCTGLTSINNMIFPFSKVSKYCCWGTFSGCTNLTSIPSDLLPCTDLTTEGVGFIYASMFAGCSSLTAIPSDLLPATTLVESCYTNMFQGCTSLTSLPSGLLRAETLADGCYSSMFEGCTSLTTVPNNLLQVQELASGCYSSMFSNCSSLENVPNLPATEIPIQAYYYMFYKCISLETIPNGLLPATVVHDKGYQHMFENCTSLTTAKLTLAVEHFVGRLNCKDMFKGCTALTEGPISFGVSNTIMDVTDEDSATEIDSSCCEFMFDGCSSLEKAPELLPTTLRGGCYSYMFHGCSSLNYVKCHGMNHKDEELNKWCTSNFLGNTLGGTFYAKSGSNWGNEPSNYPQWTWSYTL